jgi:hypothetical protein
MVIYHVSGSGIFFWDFFVLCGHVWTDTPTFWDPLQNPDKTAKNWQIFVQTKLATSPYIIRGPGKRRGEGEMMKRTK